MLGAVFSTSPVAECGAASARVPVWPAGSPPAPQVGPCIAEMVQIGHPSLKSSLACSLFNCLPPPGESLLLLLHQHGFNLLHCPCQLTQLLWVFRFAMHASRLWTYWASGCFSPPRWFVLTTCPSKSAASRIRLSHRTVHICRALSRQPALINCSYSRGTTWAAACDGRDIVRDQSGH